VDIPNQNILYQDIVCGLSLHELFEQNTPHLNPESCNEKILFLMLSFSTLNETLKYLEIGLALKSLFNIKP
jgi:hypothetical protein